MKRILSVIALATAASFGASAASAAPPSPAALAPSGVHSHVEKVHGYHRGCRAGPARWHRHLRSGRNVRCHRRWHRGAWVWGPTVYVGPRVHRRHYRHHRRPMRRHHRH